MPVPVRIHRHTAYQVRHQRIAQEMLDAADVGGNHVRTTTGTLLCAAARLMRKRMIENMQKLLPHVATRHIEASTTLTLDTPENPDIPKVITSARIDLDAFGTQRYTKDGEPYREHFGDDTLEIDLDRLVTLNGGTKRLLKRHAVPPKIMRTWGVRNPSEPVYPLYGTPYAHVPYEEPTTELAQLLKLGLPMQALCLLMPEETFIRAYDLLVHDAPEALVEPDPLLP